MAKLKHALMLMCVIYTIIISGMFLVGWTMSDSSNLFVPTPAKALMMLLFSALLGFASLLLKKDGTGAVRFVLHYVICLISFVITVVIGGGVSLTGSTPVVAVLLFSVIYAVSMILRAIVCRRGSKKSVETQVYTSVFK